MDQIGSDTDTHLLTNRPCRPQQQEQHTQRLTYQGSTAQEKPLGAAAAGCSAALLPPLGAPRLRPVSSSRRCRMYASISLNLRRKEMQRMIWSGEQAFPNRALGVRRMYTPVSFKLRGFGCVGLRAGRCPAAAAAWRAANRPDSWHPRTPATQRAATQPSHARAPRQAAHLNLAAVVQGDDHVAPGTHAAADGGHRLDLLIRCIQLLVCSAKHIMG